MDEAEELMMKQLHTLDMEEAMMMNGLLDKLRG
jgi:hypothetical protein